MTKIYKGKAISKLHPSGYYEIYSDCAGRFLKFDRVGDAKARIDQERKGCGNLRGGLLEKLFGKKKPKRNPMSRRIYMVRSPTGRLVPAASLHGARKRRRRRRR